MNTMPLNFMQWIDDNREKLKPPVCNQVVWQDREFIVMVVGGPNRRKDFHVDVAEEFFYQLEGDMVLKIMDEGKPQDINIKQGEIFLLPANVPHSPQRFAETVGLVIERRRHSDELDGFQWYCENCHHLLYEEYSHITDIVKQLPAIFERFWQDDDKVTCSQCGTRLENHA